MAPSDLQLYQIQVLIILFLHVWRQFWYGIWSDELKDEVLQHATHDINRSLYYTPSRI